MRSTGGKADGLMPAIMVPGNLHIRYSINLTKKPFRKECGKGLISKFTIGSFGKLIFVFTHAFQQIGIGARCSWHAFVIEIAFAAQQGKIFGNNFGGVFFYAFLIFK
jgi:hypothetical protein